MADETHLARVPAHLAEADAAVVIGLGRFGSAVAMELMEVGVEVLGVDSDEELVQQHAGELTHVVRADATNKTALRQLSIPDFQVAVVGIGTDVESSILASSLLVDFAIPAIWAKAISEPHGRILRQLGVHQVVFPEREMGRRVAHLARGAMLDYVELDEGFAIVKTVAPSEAVGVPLREAQLRSKHGVTVIAVRRGDGSWTYATPDTVLEEGDRIAVTGAERDAERFALRR